LHSKTKTQIAFSNSNLYEFNTFITNWIKIDLCWYRIKYISELTVETMLQCWLVLYLCCDRLVFINLNKKSLQRKRFYSRCVSWHWFFFWTFNLILTSGSRSKSRISDGVVEMNSLLKAVTTHALLTLSMFCQHGIVNEDYYFKKPLSLLYSWND